MSAVESKNNWLSITPIESKVPAQSAWEMTSPKDQSHLLTAVVASQCMSQVTDDSLSVGDVVLYPQGVEVTYKAPNGTTLTFIPATAIVASLAKDDFQIVTE